MRKIQWLGLGLAGALAVSTFAQAAADGKATDFMKAAIKGDNSEIMLGKMAAENPTVSPKVKTFAQMLIDEHGQHLQQAQSVAQSNGIKAPTGPTAGADAESAKLHLLKGTAFDDEFTQYMIRDHQKDIEEFKREAARGDGDVSKFAEQSLPTLRKHLDAALKLEKR
jgi:putative membrane protein